MNVEGIKLSEIDQTKTERKILYDITNRWNLKQQQQIHGRREQQFQETAGRGTGEMMVKGTHMQLKEK